MRIREEPEAFSFGNVAIDDLVFADGTTTWAVPGGGAVYAALGMAVWMPGAAVVAPLGPDYPRERFATVNFSQSRRLERTMRNWGLYELDGSRHFLSRRDSLPWSAFSSRAADLGPGPYAYSHLAPMPWDHVGPLVRALRDRGARLISLDLHDRELEAHGMRELAALLAGIDIFLPSRQDTEVLLPDCAPADALRRLRERLPAVPVIGVKCGADGVLLNAAASDEILAIPAAHVDVVDATGAGDAFCGGFLVGFARTGDALEAALRGAVSASYAVAAIGPAALCDVDAGEAAARVAALRPLVRRLDR